MSGIAVVALALTALWLGLLTLVALLLVRQVALLTARFDMAMPRFDPARDGLDIGRDAPQAAIDAIPELTTEVVYVLLTSSTCMPCRELVPQLGQRRVEERVVALLAGREELAAGLAGLFPPWIRVIRDPVATSVARSLGIQSTPFAMEIERGQITGKAYLNNVSDLLRLIEARRSGARRLSRNPMEVTSNVG